ncbi:WXG100 family type VII secretion target [Streptomyces catenulae]|uniref:WXG100 family type VII secretion target n=1 Tax=Streptomyces catenulae TaxID=66875 RepID=A0ABV2YT12_9ACTN|nr:WXG100 family type VII secretion target [Streptomyces catenulae]
MSPQKPDPIDLDPTKAPVYGLRGANNAQISVDAQMLRVFSTQLGGTDGSGGLVANLATQINTINTVMSQLKLAWAGRTKEEVESFYDRWDACMTDLFGKEGDAASSENAVLPRIAFSLGAAGNNYLRAEDSIVKEFTDFKTQISGDGSGADPNAAPKDINDPKMTAIAETYG